MKYLKYILFVLLVCIIFYFEVYASGETKVFGKRARDIDFDTLGMSYATTNNVQIGMQQLDSAIAGVTVGATSDSAVTFTDNTVNNADTKKHGYLLKLNNDSTYFLSGKGTWLVPAGSGGDDTTWYSSVSVLWSSVNQKSDTSHLHSNYESTLPSITNNALKYLRVKSDTTGLEWETTSGGGGADDTTWYDSVSVLWDSVNVKQDILTNSLGLANALNDETGTGHAVFDSNQVFGNLAIGVANSTTWVYVDKTSYFDTVFRFDGVSTYTNNTPESKTTRGTAYAILTDNNDYFYVMKSASTFNKIYFDISTAASTTTILAEYSKIDSTWGTLTIVDGTSNLTVDGAITFTPPVDWDTTIVNSVNGYWVRLYESATTSTDATAYLTKPDSNTILNVLGNAGDTVPAIMVNANGNILADDINSSDGIVNFISSSGITITSMLSSGNVATNSSIFSSPVTTTSSVDGLVLYTATTSSAASPNHLSPRMRMYSRNWDSTNSDDDILTYSVEAIGASSLVPTAKLSYKFDYDGGGYTEIMYLTDTGNVWVAGDCSAQSFTDRTPAYDGNALEEIKNIKNVNGMIDHESLPIFVKGKYKEYLYSIENGEKIQTGFIEKPGRNLGNMISVLTKAVQELITENEDLKNRISILEKR